MKLSLSIAALVAAGTATPVEKVIELISNLKTQCQDEQSAEQEVYDKYSCFCKDNTDDKSDAIIASQTKIDELAASIEEGAGTRDRLASEISELQKEIMTLDKEMKEAAEKHLADRTHREAVIADLSKAVSSLQGAINAVSGSKDASLVSVKATIKKQLIVAEVLGLRSAQKLGSAFLQSSQQPDYEFHSDGIVDTLNELHDDFSDKLSVDEDELAKAIKAHEDLMTAKTDARNAADETSKNKAEEKAETITQLGEDKEDLTEERQALSLSQLYLKDLTKQCELKAREFDQRAGMRKGELNALTSALDILENKVKSKDESANKRTFLNQSKAQVQRAVTDDFSDDDIDGLSFVQVTSSQRIATLLESGKAAKVNAVIQQLAKFSQGSKNVALLQFAMRLKDGPFDKVKKLIAQLVERLLQESADEATHKGWCDTEMMKANKERDYKHEKANKLNAELEQHEATKASNEADVERLTDEIAKTTQEQADADEARTQEKANNEKTLADAKDGHEAVSDAIRILKNFYKGEHGVGGANSASVSLLQASPVAEDEPASFDGAYQGNQSGANGILGMLAVIKSDFQRTVEVVTKSETEAARAHVKFSRESATFLSGAETEKKNKENVVKEMTHAINTGMEDLTATMDLLDNAVKTLEDLQPACVDTGMSYEDRKKKREEEMDALKTALCQLDPEHKEADCP